VPIGVRSVKPRKRSGLPGDARYIYLQCRARERGQSSCNAPPIRVEPVHAHLLTRLQEDALAQAVKLARLFHSPNIRLFSFYGPAKGEGTHAQRADGRGEKADWRRVWRDEVFRRLNGLAVQVARDPVTLVLENESDLYGDHPAQCVEIFQSVRSPKLRMAFDFANFISRKHLDVYEEGWKPLQPYVSHVHVKDHVPGAKTACVAGQGAGRIRDVLADLAARRYDGFLTLEPHLTKAEKFSGFSGLERFKTAAYALFALCRQVGLATQ
jgi:sugar phosphate isomerase/epimerase